MFGNVARAKCLLKICILCLLVLLVLLYITWFKFLTGSIVTHQDDEKVSSKQLHYVDSKGVHVVIGHYLGESAFNHQQYNLTDELLNSNMYDPKPNEGENGQPVIIPSFLSERMNQLFQINKFNLLASDRISLNRKLPDVRRKACLNDVVSDDKEGRHSVSVIIVFHNEAWSTLLRTVMSVINRSPKYLVKEIILVDDASTRVFLKSSLNVYVSKLNILTYVIHLHERKGLIRSRLLGAQQAKGTILVFLDAHCECTAGWLEGLVKHVSIDRTHVACPVIDIINDQTFAYIRSFEKHIGAFNWDLHFRWYTAINVTQGRRHQINSKINETEAIKPFRTPVMAGGLFAINKEYFFEIGGYDSEMDIWGGENLEMSFRIWQCGGSISIIPCSHVGHLFRKSSPYLFPGGVSEVLYSNLIRVANVWMDEWSNFYFRFHPEAAHLKRNHLATRKRKQLRSKLKCRSFEWYLSSVWPQRFMPMKNRFFGKIEHIHSNLCLEKPASKTFHNQPSGLVALSECTSEKDLFQLFVMSYDLEESPRISTIATDESVCLDVSLPSRAENSSKVYMSACVGSEKQKWYYSPENLTIRNVQTNYCIEALHHERALAIKTCSVSFRQQWILKSTLWE